MYAIRSYYVTSQQRTDKCLLYIVRLSFLCGGIKLDKMSETKKKRKVRKVEPYTQAWEREANILARSWVSIRPCKDSYNFV